MRSKAKGWLNKLFGGQGEQVAEKYLSAKGFRILARNMSNSFGEIDLIAEDQGTIVFVEVKTRASHRAGHPTEAVDFRKQRQLTRVALVWLKDKGLLERRARFDVMAITWEAQSNPIVEHYQSAFDAADLGQMF